MDIYQPKESVLELIEELGLTFPVLLDRGGRTIDSYNIYFIPLSYIIDPSGRILDVFAGAPSDKELDEMIRRYWTESG